MCVFARYAPDVPKYVRIRDTEVDPTLLASVHDIVRRALPDLDLGAEPEVGWFADTRTLPEDRVRSAPAVFVPGDGYPKAGNVPPFVRYSAQNGWTPPRPLILLNRDACPPDTALHELRHLWQIRTGRYRADQYATPDLEADADAWAAAAMVRLRIPPAWSPSAASGAEGVA
jgi:hypothetical protein